MVVPKRYLPQKQQQKAALRSLNRSSLGVLL